jgi:hypothetical protein
MTTLEKYDVEELKRRLPMVEVLQREGVAMRRVGSGWVGRCPFHEERTGSFHVGSERPDRAKCFGCGWGGDVVQYWMESHEVDFNRAVEELASLCGMSPRLEGVRFQHEKRGKGKGVREKEEKKERVKPMLPPMRGLREAELVQLAELRGLSVEAVRVAAVVLKRVGFAWWPMQQECGAHGWLCSCKSGRRGEGETRRGKGEDGEARRGGDAERECVPLDAWRRTRWSVPCWVVTDGARAVAQFRRLDGGKFFDREGMKCWTLGSPTWPLGAGEMGSRRWVLMVEGGADMLAAYHFLWGFSMLESVAVCCMLGAGQRIGEDALPFFRERVVRILADADETKVKELRPGPDGQERFKYSTPGLDAAKRWEEQLRGVGALVESCSLYGLVQCDGSPVKDVNDLAKCSAKTVMEEGIGELFCKWDF